MKFTGLWLGLAAAVAVGAIVAEARPFDEAVHTWVFALAESLLGAGLVAFAARSLWLGGSRAKRAAGASALGGGVLAWSVVYASFVVGQPQRILAAPGQVYRPPHASGFSLAFPDVSIDSLNAKTPVTSVEIAADRPARLEAGRVLREGPYVFRAEIGPLAYVNASSPSGSPQTVTHPSGGPFASQFLTFPTMAEGHPVDVFAVPALHRIVTAVYYAGLPSRNINIPFLLLRLAEENGGTLYEGVAVGGRPLVKAGVRLQFVLGTYPTVTMASAPSPLAYAVGLLLFVAGLVAFAVLTTLERAKAARPGRRNR